MFNADISKQECFAIAREWGYSTDAARNWLYELKEFGGFAAALETMVLRQQLTASQKCFACRDARAAAAEAEEERGDRYGCRPVYYAAFAAAVRGYAAENKRIAAERMGTTDIVPMPCGNFRKA